MSNVKSQEKNTRKITLKNPMTVKSVSLKSRKSSSISKSVIISKQHRKIAISWVLHSIKNVIGYEQIRKIIIEYFFPDITNPEKIKTFDASVEYIEGNEKDYNKNYKKKTKELLDYCKETTRLQNYVVFTATNIEEFREEDRDLETHYQMFIVDNENRKLYVIDPAIKDGEPGIYVPQIAIDIIMPFFEENGYNTQIVELTSPAQIDDTEESADIFCQSWTLYILIKFLENKVGNHINNTVINIPKNQKDKYKILLKFYKDIFSNIQELQSDLRVEYIDELKKNKVSIIKTLQKVDPFVLLMDMTPIEMF